MARLIALLLAGLLSFAASANDGLAAIRARLEARPNVRAEFVQTRRSPDLERPLVTRGRMVVWGEGGVLWETVQPVRSTVALRPASTVVVDEGGARAVRDVRDDALAARIGRVLRAVVHGDGEALERWFRVAPRVEGGRWSLVLTPHRGPLASAIESIQVTGGDYVEAVSIAERGGDATEIRFTGHRDAAPLSEAERSLLLGP
jgi:hypothetical protein